MSIEYKDRGAFHRIVNKTKFKPHTSKNALIRLTAKSALRIETTGLFVKDLATNRLVGKEFHIRFDRQQDKKGEYHTRFKIVRADAPIYKEKGILHRASDFNRRLEGDVPPLLKKEITLLKPLHKVALGSETLLIKTGSVGINKIKQNARNEVDNFDTGKMVLSTITTAKTINNARKAVINHRLKKTSFALKKASFENEKSKFQAVKKDFSAKKSTKELTKFDKKLYKNQKKRFKNARRQKELCYTAPLIVKGGSAVIGKVTASVWQKMIATDSNNDFLTATSKITNGVAKVNQVRKNYKNKEIRKSEKKATKLTNQENKLKSQESKLKKSSKNNKKSKTTKQTTNKISKAVKNIEKAIFDFAKFAFKGLGTILAPIILVIFLFALLLMMFAGTSQNSTYILGTYNCVDSDMGKAIDAYTKVAYDYNKNIIKCQDSSSWKSGLSAFGVDTSSYDDTPTEFIFGRSENLNYDAVYDFDYDKFIAFMCAYTYPFSSDDTSVSDNEDVVKWTYNWSYDSVIEDLFYAEYEFQHEYINTSHWVSLSSYEIFPSNDSLWYVEGSGTTNVSGVTYGFIRFSSHSAIPSELKSFTNDDSIHFDLSTGEVKNRKKSYAKTGYYIQNLNYEYYDGSGGKVNSFYSLYSDDTGYFYLGFNVGGTDYRKTQLVVGSMNFDYVVAKEDVQKYVGNSTENRQLMRDFKAEEYVTECKLYTNVKQIRTFDEAIRYILNNQEYSASRIEFYNTLLNAETLTYGNHQTYKSPLSSSFSSLITSNKIYNRYGYDMQAWDTTHCSLEKHHGLDIEATSGTNVRAMITGKVDSIDTSKHTITLIGDDIEYWYDKNKKRQTKITYINVNVSSTLNVGDSVNVGDIIGNVSDYKHCNGNFNNENATKNYLHIGIQINYGNAFVSNWCDVDPRFLIYLD